MGSKNYGLTIEQQLERINKGLRGNRDDKPVPNKPNKPGGDDDGGGFSGPGVSLPDFDKEDEDDRGYEPDF